MITKRTDSNLRHPIVMLFLPTNGKPLTDLRITTKFYWVRNLVFGDILTFEVLDETYNLLSADPETNLRFSLSTSMHKTD